MKRFLGKQRKKAASGCPPEHQKQFLTETSNDRFLLFNQILMAAVQSARKFTPGIFPGVLKICEGMLVRCLIGGPTASRRKRGCFFSSSQKTGVS
jgi:hypothetical protein